MIHDPEALSESVFERENLCLHYLRILYHDNHQTQANTEHNLKNIHATPGEILPLSISKLLNMLPLTHQDVFIDLGSGNGKIVLQVFLQSNVQEAMGIEIIPAFHQQAIRAEVQLRHDLPDFFADNRKTTFLLGSFLDLPFGHATVAIINSLCLAPHTVNALGRIIDDTTNIHTVMTLRPIPTLQRLSFQKTVRVECSWDSALCYIYS
jgi:hypothetical protein